MSAKEWFSGRTIVIASRHQKEEVIAPILEHYLGCRCMVPADLDTDRLGTFSGEVARKHSPLEAARRKCLMALAEADGDLCIASEGSFGPHPEVPFCVVNEELVLLMDTRTGFELAASKTSFETNYNGEFITSSEELRAFAEKALFPSHGLVVRKSPQSIAGIVKGITSWATLDAAFRTTCGRWDHAYVETDMRAMHNPLRMETIKAATLRLIGKLENQCPRCFAPGFEVVRQTIGLPCALCSQPTRSAMASTCRCPHCHFESDTPFPQQKTTEDPAHCDNCNP